MKNKIKKSIGYKLFLVTTLLLVISSMCTYAIVYLLLPSNYYKYKEITIENELDNAVTVCENLDIKNMEEYFDKFSTDNNCIVLLSDKYGRAIYITNFPRGERIYRPRIEELPHFKDVGDFKRKNIYRSYRKIKFSNDDEVYTIYLSTPLQPISEASKVLVRLIPYIILAVILISVIGGFIYSKFVSKPLLDINKVAKEMVKLDFTKKCFVKGEDEIGELSKSLNNLSNNLQISMENLQKANEKLLDDIAKEREIEKKRREFIATISHELKTPITILKGQIEGMLSNIGVYKDRDKYLKRNLEVLNDMEHMVKDTLEISKMESEGFKPKKDKVDLGKIVQECLYKTSFIATNKNISIYKTVKENLFICGDNTLLKKVVYNIITNSINHSYENERVYVEMYEENNKVVLRVENTGVNIEEKEMEKIFKAFYRIEKSRNRKNGGSGLGLYIVKTILDAHEAEYCISNNENSVEFKVWFNKWKS